MINWGEEKKGVCVCVLKGWIKRLERIEIFKLESECFSYLRMKAYLN